MILKKALTVLTFLSLFTLLSCSKDNDTPAKGSYPKTVKVTYKITGTVKKGSVIFSNETLGNTNLDNQTIPFTKEISATIKSAPSGVALGITSVEAGSAKLEILVDDKVVETKDFSSNTVVSGSIAYVFQ
jgi:hypothetical protein